MENGVESFILILGIFVWQWITGKIRNKLKPDSNLMRKIGKITVYQTPIIHQNDLTLVRVHRGKFEDEVDCAVKVIRHFGTLPGRWGTTFLKSLEKNEKASKGSYIRPSEIQIGQIMMLESHKNIVRYFCHETCECEHPAENTTIYTIYIAIELCDCNLEEFIKMDGIEQLSTDDICLQIARGLAYLHGKKIVHRDLKPANILLKKASDSETFIVKLADFGMSKYISHSSEATLSMKCGTPGWQAPEIQTENEKVGGEDQIKVKLKKSDVYSLGLVFCFVVSKDLHTDFDVRTAEGKDPYTMQQLIIDMTSSDPEKRPTAEMILKHPAMWTAKRTLEFFSKSSDLISGHPHDHMELQNRWDEIFTNNWKDALDINVQNHLFTPMPSIRPYDSSLVKDLLRAIRNKYSHENTTLFGSYPDQYLKYWTSRFRRLLLYTYKHMGNFPYDQIREFY